MTHFSHLKLLQQLQPNITQPESSPFDTPRLLPSANATHAKFNTAVTMCHFIGRYLFCRFCRVTHFVCEMIAQLCFSKCGDVRTVFPVYQPLEKWHCWMCDFKKAEKERVKREQPRRMRETYGPVEEAALTAEQLAE